MSINIYQSILKLWLLGKSKREIALVLGIEVTIVEESLNAHELELPKIITGKLNGFSISDSWNKHKRENYAYLLSAYLGDGYINSVGKTYRLRISLDSKYPGIIEKCKSSIKALLPNNVVAAVKKRGENCYDVSCYSNWWPTLFPQHGVGTKHARPIILEPWQQQIVDEYPIEFLRGFIHTDGCRFDPVINNTVYSRYQFTNLSEDILALFIATCDKLGISCTRQKRNLTIARRKDVEFLDQVIGPKM